MTQSLPTKGMSSGLGLVRATAALFALLRFLTTRSADGQKFDIQWPAKVLAQDKTHADVCFTIAYDTIGQLTIDDPSWCPSWSSANPADFQTEPANFLKTPDFACELQQDCLDGQQFDVQASIDVSASQSQALRAAKVNQTEFAFIRLALSGLRVAGVGTASTFSEPHHPLSSNLFASK